MQLSEKELDEFHTSFREIMKYIKYSQNGKKLGEMIGSDKRFESVERQAADVINAVTGTKIKHLGKEEKVNMCLAIQELEISGAILAYKKIGVSQEDTKQYIMEEYQKSEEEAEKLLEEYWK